MTMTHTRHNTHISLLHPLSPRGKLVHWGLEGLEATNRLLEAATAATAATTNGKSREKAVQQQQQQQQQHDTITQMILRNQLYRVATTRQHVEQLRATAQLLPNLCIWKQPDELPTILRQASSSSSHVVLGALLLKNGCKVLHVPTYLRALWKACEQISNNSSSVVWSLEHDWRKDIHEYDAVVYAAGSGLFEQQQGCSCTDALLSVDDFPIQLVRGQSAELKLSAAILQRQEEQDLPALLCGKYISPLPEPNMVLVGATHEFCPTPMDRESVVQELKERTQDAAPWIWGDNDDDDATNNGPQIHRWASGIRVQSERGRNGRMPLIGRLATKDHPNTWIFTGLSSRGLLYHGIYGDILTDAILANTEDVIHSRCEDLTWWKEKVKAK